MKNSIKNVFVIVASIIGAGFASGREIYSFFFIYEKCGVWGILLSNLIISLVVYRVLSICKEKRINSYFNFCDCIVKNNKFCSLFLNKIVNNFLLISFFIMVVGFAGVLQQEFGFYRIIGAVLIIIFNYIFTRRNEEGLIKLSNYLIPIYFIFLVIIISKMNIFSNFIFNKKEICNYQIGIIDNWIVKSVLYASYNCVIIIPVLVILSAKIKNEKSIIKISIINFFVLIFFSLSIFGILLKGDSFLYQLEMPVVAVIAKVGEVYRLIYIFLIIVSIATSIISTSLGFLNNISDNSKKFKRNLIIISLFALPISYIKFGDLVNYLYPVMGFIGIIELLFLIDFRRHIIKIHKRKGC